MALQSSKILIPIRKLKRAADPVTKAMKAAGIRFELCGGLRRGDAKDTQVFLVVSSLKWAWHIIDSVSVFDARSMNMFTVGSGGLSFTIDGIRFSLQEAPGSYWGTSVLFSTGTLGFVKTMVAHARCMGYALRRNGLFLGELRIAGKTEKQVFEVLGFPYIKPTRRFPQKPYSKMFNGCVPLTRKRNKEIVTWLEK